MTAPAQTHTFTTYSAAETRACGERLASLLQPPIVLALHGDLGAGKTTLTQGIAHGLGIRQRVTSPTFTLVNEYTLANARRLVHIDGYRLSPGEAETIGLDEILYDERAIVIIEWAERVAEWLPVDHLEARISALDGDKRKVVVTAFGVQSMGVLARLC